MTFQMSRLSSTEYSDGEPAFPTSTRSTFGCRLTLPDPKAFAVAAGIAIAASLVLAMAVAAAAGTGRIAVEGILMTVFWVEAERNVPTFLNFALLAFAFCLLTLISFKVWSEASTWRWHWTILTGVFLLLTFDEAARMHEMLGTFGREIVAAEGIFRFAWVVVALPVVIVFALGFLRFLIALPRRPALLMLISGVVYVGAALGLEMVNAALFDAADGHRNGAYAFFTLMEEGLEMAGMTLFSVALLTYLSMRPASR